jgi:hypothetical protein
MQTRPFLAALLMAAAGALLVGGCFVAARLGGAWGSAAALLGFAGYLLLFARGLDQLPVNWNSWRERNYKEFHEETEEQGDRNQGNQGGKP